MARLKYCGELRDYFSVPRDTPTLRIERAYLVNYRYNDQGRSWAYFDFTPNRKGGPGVLPRKMFIS